MRSSTPTGRLRRFGYRTSHSGYFSGCALSRLFPKGGRSNNARPPTRAAELSSRSAPVAQWIDPRFYLSAAAPSWSSSAVIKAIVRDRLSRSPASKQRSASRMSLANARSAFVRTRAISAARSPTAKGSKGSLAVIRGRDSDGFALPHRRKAHPLKHPGLLLRRQGVPVGFRLPLSGSPLMPGKPRVFPGARQAHSQAALG